MKEITPNELQALLACDAPPLLVDVREQIEADIAQIAGSQLIPMGSLPHRLQELPKERAVALYCHHGMRSARAVQFLRQMGFDRSINLAGGIDAWSEEVDSSVPRY